MSFCSQKLGCINIVLLLLRDRLDCICTVLTREIAIDSTTVLLLARERD